MATLIDIEDARIYVGTYAKYTNGSIFGEWLQLSEYSDLTEFYEACAALHKDEEDPEYMFQDYENIPNGLISESWISEKIFEVIEAFQQLEENEKEPFAIWCDNGSRDLAKEDTDALISSFQEDYQGLYKDEVEYAYEIVEECYDLPDFAKAYFDYEKFARDLFMTDYWFEDGHVFRNS